MIVDSGGSLDLNGQIIAAIHQLILYGTGSSGSGALTNSNTTNGATWNGPVALGSATTVDGPGSITITGSIGGPGSLTKTNTGMLILSGTNTYTGGTLIDGGILTINADSGLGGYPTPAATNITFDGGTGGTLRTGGTMTLNANRGVLLTAIAIFDTQSYILTIPGVMSGTGGLTKAGTGSLVLSGANISYSGNVTVSGGTLDLGNDMALGSSTTLTIANGATVKEDATVMQVTNLTMGGTAKLDLNKHDLIWHGADIDAVRGLLSSGYNGGGWNAASGITTSSCDTNYGYGVMLGSIWQALYSGQQFDGVTVSSTDILLKYTWKGDTTLKGTVDAMDFAQIDAAYLKGIYASGGARWL